jgi:hypothetical protein
MKEALHCSQTSVLTRATRRNIPEDAFFIVTVVKTSNLTAFNLHFLFVIWCKIKRFSDTFSQFPADYIKDKNWFKFPLIYALSAQTIGSACIGQKGVGVSAHAGSSVLLDTIQLNLLLDISLCYVGPLVTTAWRVLGLRMEGTASSWRLAANILTSSRGQTTRGGPPAWGLGVVLTTPHRKKQACYEKDQWASDLDRFFG